MDSHSALKDSLLEEGRQLLELITSHKSGTLLPSHTFIINVCINIVTFRIYKSSSNCFWSAERTPFHIHYKWRTACWIEFWDKAERQVRRPGQALPKPYMKRAGIKNSRLRSQRPLQTLVSLQYLWLFTWRVSPSARQMHKSTQLTSLLVCLVSAG